MRIFAVLAVAVGATMSLTPNTTGDSVAGALFVVVGLLVLFWPPSRSLRE